MKLTLEQTECAETEIFIRYATMSNSLRKLIDELRTQQLTIELRQGNEIFAVAIDDILYFESVDKKTFAYTSNAVYESAKSLQSILIGLKNKSFVRISKSCAINVAELVSITPLWNMRYEANLTNGEKIIVNRHYIGELKQKLGIMEEQK